MKKIEIILMEENNGGFHTDNCSVDCIVVDAVKKHFLYKLKQRQTKRVMLLSIK